MKDDILQSKRLFKGKLLTPTILSMHPITYNVFPLQSLYIQCNPLYLNTNFQSYQAHIMDMRKTLHLR